MKRNAVSWAALVMAVAAFVGSRTTTRALPAAQQIPAEGQKAAKALSEAFNAVAEFTKPSVVQINVEKRTGGVRGGQGGKPGGPGEMAPKELQELMKKFFGENGPGQGFKFEKQQFAAEGTGSGFVYDEHGHILTNNHVVSGADRITVTFQDGEELPAKVIGTHPESDVAVIKVESNSYRPLPRGQSSNLKVGEWVMAIGSPFGLDQTVTAGIISATQRNDVGINRFESFLQTDAAINPGNSGGPLVDMNGRVVGINSAIATASRSNSGVGFAIPIDMASRLADKLIKNGKIAPALLGVGIDPVTPVLAHQLSLDPKTKGLLVTEVGKDTPAEKAGLKIGDIITNFDGQPVFTRKDLQYLVGTSDIGQEYKLTLLRDKATKTVTVSPTDATNVYASLNRDRKPAGDDAKPEEAPKVAKTEGLGIFGLSATPLTEELAKKYDYDLNHGGVVVTEVTEGSPAAEAGIEVGDRITKVIKDAKIQPVNSIDDLKAVVATKDVLAIYVEDVNKKQPGQIMTLVKPKVEEKKEK
jgi:serine protease Do